jgi:hypothetical protein
VAEARLTIADLRYKLERCLKRVGGTVTSDAALKLCIAEKEKCEHTLEELEDQIAATDAALGESNANLEENMRILNLPLPGPDPDGDGGAPPPPPPSAPRDQDIEEDDDVENKIDDGISSGTVYARNKQPNFGERNIRRRTNDDVDNGDDIVMDANPITYVALDDGIQTHAYNAIKNGDGNALRKVTKHNAKICREDLVCAAILKLYGDGNSVAKTLPVTFGISPTTAEFIDKLIVITNAYGKDITANVFSHMMRQLASLSNVPKEQRKPRANEILAVFDAFLSDDVNARDAATMTINSWV